ncbi:MAG: hypothetical protein ACTSXU_09470 [Promethearchaeota archaeon]
MEMKNDADPKNNDDDSRDISGSEKPVRKSNDFSKKLYKIMNENFSNIFSKEHRIYTLIFFVSVSFLVVLGFFKSNALINVVAIGIASSIALTFTLLFILSNIQEFNSLLLKSREKAKFGIFLFILLISSSIYILIYYLFQSFLSFDITEILQLIYVFIFFGWNMIQIFYIKKGFESISIKVEQKVYKGFEKEENHLKKIDNATFPFLALSIITPFIMLSSIILLFLSYPGGNISHLTNNLSGTFLFFIWVVLMYLYLAWASFHLIKIHVQCTRMWKPTIFAPFQHMLLNIYIIYRSYSFIKAMNKFHAGKTIDIGDNILDAIILIASLLLIFKGLGNKLKRFSFLNQHNIPFMSFSITTLIIVGRMVMVLVFLPGDLTVSSSQALATAINNLLMTLVAMLFYAIYLRKRVSSYLIERDFSENQQTIKLEPINQEQDEKEVRDENEHPSTENMNSNLKKSNFFPRALSDDGIPVSKENPSITRVLKNSLSVEEPSRVSPGMTSSHEAIGQLDEKRKIIPDIKKELEPREIIPGIISKYPVYLPNDVVKNENQKTRMNTREDGLNSKNNAGYNDGEGSK